MLMQSGNPLGGALAGVAFPALGLAALLAGAALLTGVPGIAGLGVEALRQAGAPSEPAEAIGPAT
jgi:hypothetical protein